MHRNAVVSGFLQQQFHGRTAPLEILEAGCGRSWPLDLGQLQFKITGVDSDTDALNARSTEIGDLHKAIAGDLRSITFEENSFDLVYSCEVLEHVNGAEAVVKRFSNG